MIKRYFLLLLLVAKTKQSLLADNLIIVVESSILSNYKGQVKITGKIYIKDTDTFNGSGIKDADTIHLNVFSDSVSFRNNEDADWKVNLKVLDNCFYKDEEHGLKPVIERHASFSLIKVRLQGIDSPELHYSAIQNDVKLTAEQQALFEKEKDISYRQKWGGISSKELFDKVKPYFYSENGKTFVDAYMLSKVDKPSNLFDKFGRAIGDVYISETNENINKWLVKNGWAFPDFYNSMSETEIIELQNLGDHATNPYEGIRGSYSQELVPFDSSLIFDFNNPQIDYGQDKGKINLPKFFRKQVDYEILKRCGIPYTNLKEFIQLTDRKCYKTEEVLNNSSVPALYSLASFMDEGDRINVHPGGLIYIESSSQLFDVKGDILAEDEWY